MKVTTRARAAELGSELDPSSSVEVLRAILEEIRGLRADLAAKKTRSAADPVSNEQFLAAIAASNPHGACFSAVELLAHAMIDPTLRQALSGYTTARRLGNKLRRLAGLDIGGFVLRVVERDATGCIWQIHTRSRTGDEGGS